jgi:hypothetical protein
MTMAEPQQPKAPKDRSPSFPFIGLSTALDRLSAFEQKFGRHPAPANKAGLAWGMKEGSSQAQQTLAALKSFGMVEYTGSGDQRIAALTEEGRNYLRAQQESVKAEIRRGMALKPKLIAYYWRKWGADRPIKEVCLDQLVLNGGFTQSAAETFLRVYDSTIGYAGLAGSDKRNGVEEEDTPADDVEIGDLIQVEIGGADTLPSPARVRAVQEHDGQMWVFIDGSESGVPMEQVRIEQKGSGAQTPPPMLALQREQDTVKPGWKEERLLDDAGGEIFIRYEGEPSEARYTFIRDYLDFKLGRMKK